MLKKIVDWIHNLSLYRKIMLLVFLVVVIPMGGVFMISLSEVQKASEKREMYVINQSFGQVSQAVENSLEELHNISDFLAANDVINRNLNLFVESQNMAVQLAYFENISTYTNGLEMIFGTDNIIFYIDKEFSVNYQNERYRTLESAQKETWYGSLKNNNGQPTWVNYTEEGSGKEYVAVTRKIWNQDNYDESIAILNVLIEKKYLKEMLVGSATNQVIYLETAEGELLASNVEESDILRLPLGNRAVGKGHFERVFFSGEEYFVCSTMLDNLDIYLVSLIPVVSFEKEINAVNVRLNSFYLAVSVLILLIFFFIVRSSAKRVMRLKQQMIQMQSGVMKKVELEKEYKDEIGQLMTHYNEMVDKMEVLMEEQYELGQEKIEAELKALQSQINPHFLYNTLDMINWMAQKNETDNIKNVVCAMSRFYRLTLSKGHDIVTIGDEIQMCEAYMEIQRRRYKGKILYEVEIDDDVRNCLIPKITLQPFLENAIIHGINEKEDGRGIVMLNGWIEDDRVTLSVTDDGNGMNQDDKTKASGSQYGMKNIAKRLKLYYGEDIPIQVESSQGIGTCVIINVPIRRKTEDIK